MNDGTNVQEKEGQVIGVGITSPGRRGPKTAKGVKIARSLRLRARARKKQLAALKIARRKYRENREFLSSAVKTERLINAVEAEFAETEKRVIAKSAEAKRTIYRQSAERVVSGVFRNLGVRFERLGRATLAILAIGLFVSGCAHKKNALSKGQIKSVWEQASDKTYLRTRGIGAAPRQAESETHRRGLARNAALVAARYEMLQVIKGLRLSGGLTVEKLMQTDGRIREVADRIIAGAEEEMAEWTSDGGCVVLLRLERSKVERIIAETAAHEGPVLDESVANLPGLKTKAKGD